MASIVQALRDVWDIFDKLAQKLQPCDPQEIRESIESLNGKLRLLKPFLEDSIPEEKDKIQTQLENDLKVLVAEIETLINNFHRECQQNLPDQEPEKLYKKIYVFCKGLLAKITQPSVEARFEGKVRKLKRKVREFEINKNEYGKNFDVKTCKRRKMNHIDDPEIFDFNTDIEKIVGWLCDGQVVDRVLVSIVGIGGGGKSTITKKICNRVAKLASQRAVVVFGKSSCYMSHTVTRLFIDLGVNPTVHELDQDLRGREMERAIARLLGSSCTDVPTVFIGGKLVGSTDKVMALHLSGGLIPLLRNAGALWM